MFNGKRIANCYYIHKSETVSSDLNPKIKVILQEYDLSEIPFDHDVIKLNTTDNSITLIKCDEFDKWLNPKLIQAMVIQGDTQKILNYKTDNKLIYHRKHEFVNSNYTGFNIELSKQWVEFYETSGIIELNDKNKIGYTNFWKQGLIQLFDVEGFTKFKPYCKNILG